MDKSLLWYSPMSLSQRLITLRKERGLSQQAIAEVIGLHPNSWKKYETGQAMPSVDALTKIAKTLNVSTDFLLFDEHERVPENELSLQFEAISQLPENEQSIIKEVLEGMIIKYQARRWDSARLAKKKDE
ncbi:helix-turn-helix transcriptional regulator [Gilliamella sp. ESL0441]|nr:helix-turn-helix domain-containing protein [Gilliamella sp. ESL0441]QYN44941.1 helix-turn-helix transcriptional regulator [Gilliamella sp. ESL0441]QYN44947.1 helix-turn-helix transcriptional regulator [Gilliamella sp. ESL0441]